MPLFIARELHPSYFFLKEKVSKRTSERTGAQQIFPFAPGSVTAVLIGEQYHSL